MPMATLEAAQDHLRGLPLECVLKGFGQLLQDAVADDATFALSAQVSHVHAFLTHTWSTPRWRKFTTLSMHFNFMTALSVAFFLGVVVSVLAGLGVLPVFDVRPGGWHERHPSAPYALVLVCFSFPVLVHVIHEVPPKGSTTVFLDKACIDQTDAESKVQGISNLGVTCFFSWKLIVLDCDDYLERLWTVYELSSFLLRPRCEFLFLPVKLPLAVWIMSMTATAGLLMVELRKTTFVYDFAPWTEFWEPLAVAVTLCPMFCALAVVQRMWAREQARRLSRLECFSIAAAKCSSEPDRAPVLQNIALMMEDTGRLKNGEDALDTFDKFVREQLPKAMKASSLGYKHCVIVSLCSTAHALDSLASDVLAGEHLRVIVSRCWYWVELGLVGFPCCA